MSRPPAPGAAAAVVGAGEQVRPALLDALTGKRRWGARAEERRRVILSALRQLLDSQDLHELSVQGIVVAAGVSRSTFYTYFPTREAAVAALMTERFEVMARCAELMDERPGPAGVRAGMRAAIEDWLEHERVTLAMLDARGLDRQVADAWDYWIDMFRTRLAETVSRHRQAGLAPEGAPPELLMTVLMSANERTFERMSRGGFTRDEKLELGDALIETWVRAIFSDTPN